MAQETNQSPAPMLCANGCGFYGNPRTNGMCSVCHKETLSRQNATGSSSDVAAIQRLEVTLNNAAAAAVAAAEEAAESAAKSSTHIFSVPEPSGVTQQMTEMSLRCDERTSDLLDTEVPQHPLAHPAAGSEDPTEPPPRPKKNRCFMCRKKLGLTGFDCRCGHQFCGLHRYSDKHDCPYDYRTEAAEKIRKENPVVVADKIQRI